MMKSFAFVLMALMGVPLTAQAGCGGADTAITGTLRLFEGRHPNGTLVDVIQIVTPTPVQAATVDGAGCIAVSKVQVVPLDTVTDTALRGMVGLEVTVLSDDMFEAHTAWHFGDAVAMGAALPSE
jgi:hypothetical protein